MNKRLHNKCLSLNNKINVLRDEIYEMLINKANIWSDFYFRDMVLSCTNESNFLEDKKITEILDSFKKELLKMKRLKRDLIIREDELCKSFLEQVKKCKFIHDMFKNSKFLSLLK